MIILMIFIFVIEWIAEYYLMVWSRDDILWHLVLGSLLYLTSTIAWAFLLKLGEMSSLSIIYSAFGLISVVIIAMVNFSEEVTLQKILAIIFAVIAIILAGV